MSDRLGWTIAAVLVVAWSVWAWITVRAIQDYERERRR